MLFLLTFQLLLRVVLMSRWGVYGFRYIGLFGVVHFFQSQTFLKNLVSIFFSLS